MGFSFEHNETGYYISPTGDGYLVSTNGQVLGRVHSKTGSRTSLFDAAIELLDRQYTSPTGDMHTALELVESMIRTPNNLTVREYLEGYGIDKQGLDLIRALLILEHKQASDTLINALEDSDRIGEDNRELFAELIGIINSVNTLLK